MCDELKDLKKSLVSVVITKTNGNLDKISTKELGEVIDMIKDLAEAIYYCSIVCAMEECSGTYVDNIDKTIRDRMYFSEPASNKIHEETIEEYLSEMVSTLGTQEKAKMKERIAACVNKL